MFKRIEYIGCRWELMVVFDGLCIDIVEDVKDELKVCLWR